jgi:hypothetical protein
MANITLSETPGAAVDGFNDTKLIANTSTPVITPTFSSLERVSGPANAPQNYNIADLDAPGSGDRKNDRGFLRGRRPYFGLLFPRGYYNR